MHRNRQQQTFEFKTVGFPETSNMHKLHPATRRRSAHHLTQLRRVCYVMLHLNSFQLVPAEQTYGDLHV